jgi:hypothetical protein
VLVGREAQYRQETLGVRGAHSPWTLSHSDCRNLLNQVLGSRWSEPGSGYRTVANWIGLNLSEQNQDQHDYEDEAKPTASVIPHSVKAASADAAETAEQRNYQDDE